MSGSREDPIDKAIKDLVDRNVCPDSDMVNPIQQRLNHNKMEAILECNYGKAQECERSLEVLNNGRAEEVVIRGGISQRAVFEVERADEPEEMYSERMRYQEGECEGEIL